MELARLKGELLDAYTLSKPGERGIDELQQGNECNQVGGDVSNHCNGVRRSGCRCLNDVHLCPGRQQLTTRQSISFIDCDEK